MPDGNPGDPPASPPPQAGDPAVQQVQLVWTYLTYADGEIQLGRMAVPLQNGAASHSFVDETTGTLLTPTANFAGQTTLIQPPASPQANTVYFYNSVDGSWAPVPVHEDGYLLAPTAGYSIIPLASADGQGVAWAVQSQEQYLPASALAVNAVPPPDAPPRPPTPPDAPPPVRPRPPAPIPPHLQPPPPPGTVPTVPAPPGLPPLWSPTVVPGPGPVTVQPPPGSIPFPLDPGPQGPRGTLVPAFPVLGEPIGPNGLPLPGAGSGSLYGPFIPGWTLPPSATNPLYPFGLPGLYFVPFTDRPDR